MPPATLLFTLNYPSGTGYAWATIEQVYLRVIATLRERGWQGAVCYPPSPAGEPERFARAGVKTIPFDYERTAAGFGATLEFCRLLRRERVRLLYLTDQPTRSLRYLLYRLAGVHTIVVHDRTSGERAKRAAPVQLLKRVLHALPGYAADRFIGVSNFVVRRLIEVNGTPRRKTVRVYNGIDLTPYDLPRGPGLHAALGLEPDVPIVFASGRAMPYKGIAILIEAAARLEAAGYQHVHMAFAGDGPKLPEFRRQAEGLGLRRFHFLGKRGDVPDLIRSAAITVVPSTWAESFGLTVVEGMAAGTAVIASRVGGIPELIQDGENGLLVPPGDPEALASALRRLLDDPALRTRLGRRAREEAHARFSIERTAAELAGVLADLSR
jgi:glycosyltransferase involved in cell wall biosynthesis